MTVDQDCRERITSEDYADFIIEYEKIQKSVLDSYNFCYDIINNTYAIAYAPIATLPSNMLQLFGYSIYPSCFGLLDIGSLEASGVTRVSNIPNFNLRGQGVLIGIIDTGIDYTHEAFKNEDGTTKIVSIWDQTIESGTSPQGFYYGTEYNQEEINLALLSADPLSIVPSVDENGHGTFLAGIAAGNRSDANNFSGVAPDANIVVVKLKTAKRFIKEFFSIPSDAICYQENDIMLGIKYLLQIVKTLVRPMSICIGVGTSQGGHDERGALSSYLSTTADQKGICVSIAAGNEGNRGHHYLGTIPRTISFNTVELKVGPNNTGFSMELWGDRPNLFAIDILSPSGEYIPRIPARIGETREIRFIFEETVILIDYEIVESQTGDQLILIRFRNPAEGNWRFRVYSSGNLEPRFHIWLPIHNFLNDDTFFITPNPDFTLTSPANTILPIITTAYDYTNQSLYYNASRGYTRNNIISPSFAAPGVNIIGPTFNNGYMVGTGTSIAAAHTAGVAALLLEWGVAQGNQTLMDTIEIKNILLRGAKRDPNIVYPNREWGYGILDFYNSLSSFRG